MVVATSVPAFAASQNSAVAFQPGSTGAQYDTTSGRWDVVFAGAVVSTTGRLERARLSLLISFAPDVPGGPAPKFYQYGGGTDPEGTESEEPGESVADRALYGWHLLNAGEATDFAGDVTEAIFDYVLPPSHQMAIVLDGPVVGTNGPDPEGFGATPSGTFHFKFVLTEDGDVVDEVVASYQVGESPGVGGPPDDEGPGDGPGDDPSDEGEPGEPGTELQSSGVPTEGFVRSDEG